MSGAIPLPLLYVWMARRGKNVSASCAVIPVRGAVRVVMFRTVRGRRRLVFHTFRFVSFRSPSLFCLLTVGVEVVFIFI
jgi:hypothetical protein